MTLTPLTVSNAKPRAKAYKLADADSLYLVIQPNGTRLWRMNYRYLGKQKTLHLGAWPAVSIAAARAARDGARQKLAAGFDPAAEKKVALATARVAANNTFKGVAEEWVIKNEREGRATVTLEKIRWLLKMAYPVIGQRGSVGPRLLAVDRRICRRLAAQRAWKHAIIAPSIRRRARR